MRFAVATAMPQDEICRIRWEDIDAKARTVIVRDRKDPRDKNGNHQRVPLLDVTGFDAWAILEEQKPFSGNSSLIFPYNGRSVGTAFRRACKELTIKDLKFHDLRHEAASRLFEAGFTIEQAALVTGHKDWKMLKRYTHLRPEHLRSVRPKHIPPSLDLPTGPAPADIALDTSSNPERRASHANSAHPSQIARLHHEHEALSLSASI